MSDTGVQTVLLLSFQEEPLNPIQWARTPWLLGAGVGSFSDYGFWGSHSRKHPSQPLDPILVSQEAKNSCLARFLTGSLLPAQGGGLIDLSLWTEMFP